jgi:hypothetical protein
MANHPAAPLLLRQGDREKLTRLVCSTSVRAGLAQRARIVLLAADGISNTEIAQKVGASRTTVIAWRARYDEAGNVQTVLRGQRHWRETRRSPDPRMASHKVGHSRML